MSLSKISDIGLIEAATRLVPITVAAGNVAKVIQDALLAGRVHSQLSKADEEGYNKQALTDADLVCSNLVGAFALQFADLSYLSEEAKADNVSRYFKPNQPFVLVFDPINGTSYLKDGKPCFENIYTLCDAGPNGEVLNTRRAIVINMPRYGTVYIGDENGVQRADTSQTDFNGRGELQLIPHRIPSAQKGEVYVSVSLADRLADIQAKGLDAKVAHHVYKEYGHTVPDWGFVPAGILDGRVTAFAIKGIDLMDSLAVAYLAQGSGASVLVKGYHPETHTVDLCIASADPQIFQTLCETLV